MGARFVVFYGANSSTFLHPDAFRDLMSRIFGFVVGAVWLVFAFMAFGARSAGVAAGQPDVTFWWTVIMAGYAAAAIVALVGTARYKASGPKKPS